MPTVLIRNGTLVTPRRVAPGDVLIEGERIVAVGERVETQQIDRVIDAEGLLVLPGLIDPHVHLREPGGEHKEDLTTGTRAALAGGFTTVLAMPNTQPPLTDRRTMADAIARAQREACCDVGFFVGATPDNAEEAMGVEAAVGLKLYMGSSTGDLLVATLPGQLAHFRHYPGVIAVHAEDEEAVAHFARRGERRPPLCAALALSRALTLSERFNRRLHVCHVSTAHEIALIRDAKARGVPVTCEVTPHHLFMTSENEARLGPFGKMNPPLRSQTDVEALWANLDVVDCLATDHAPHTREEKEAPAPPSGVPGLETALPLMIDAVQERDLPLTEIARLMAQGPARAFDLQGRGELHPGLLANVTLVNPSATWTIGEAEFETKCGWSPFEGRTVRGWVERVLLRGRDAVLHGEIIAEPGSGI